MPTAQVPASADSIGVLVRDFPNHRPATILVVEDDPRLRNVMVEVLQAYAYHVLAAEAAGEAFVIFERHVEEIDLVFSDVVLKGGDGRALVERMKVLQPGLRAILSSGYPERLGEEAEGFLCLAKPFSVGTLVDKIQQALASMRRR
jgi:DNA-binding NtrC family response regulator